MEAVMNWRRSYCYSTITRRIGFEYEYHFVA
jgi:hypothetical protein